MQRAAVCHRRSPRRRDRPGVRDEADRAAAADVRRARHRPVGQRRRDAVRARRRRAEAIRRASSSTTRIPAASASARRCWGCRRSCCRRRSALIAGCDCDNGCPMCVGPIGETGPLAKTVALRMLEHLLARHRRHSSRARRGGAVLAMATLDRLREIVRTHRPSPVPVVANEAAGHCRSRGRAPRPSDASARSRRAALELGGAVVEHSDGAVIVVDREYRADMLHGRMPIGEIARRSPRAATRCS